MVNQSSLEPDIAKLIVETLHLEVAAADIDPVAPLFGEGLGLDSIDALELAMAISQEYGFKLRSDDPDNVRIFSSLRELSHYIEKNQKK